MTSFYEKRRDEVQAALIQLSLTYGRDAWVTTRAIAALTPWSVVTVRDVLQTLANQGRIESMGPYWRRKQLGRDEDEGWEDE